jgi:predicted DNA-binding WGR domain protein
MSRVHLRDQGTNGPKDWIATVSADGKLFIRYGTVGKTPKTQQIAPKNWSKSSAEAELQHRAELKRKEGYQEVFGEKAAPLVDPDSGQPITATVDEANPLIFSTKIRRNSSQETAYDRCVAATCGMFAGARVITDNSNITVAKEIEENDPMFNRWMMFLELMVRENATLHLGRRDSDESIDVTETYDQLTLTVEEMELSYVLGLNFRPLDMSQAQLDWMQSAVLV